MGVAGIGWGAIVSLPFAIMSERVDARRLGMFMGMFNLSVVLPQLVASFAIGPWLAGQSDKGSIFLIGAALLGLSALLWLFVKPVALKPTYRYRVGWGKSVFVRVVLGGSAIFKK